MGLVKRRSPDAQVQRRDGHACLLLPWDTMFSEEKWWRGGGGKEKKNPLKESGDHMSPLLLRVLVLQDLMLNIDVEDKNLDRGLNGGQF